MFFPARVERLVLAEPGHVGTGNQVRFRRGLGVARHDGEVWRDGHLGWVLVKVVVGHEGDRFDGRSGFALDVVEGGDP